MTSNPKMKILILGISGMLGSTLFQYLRSSKNFEVFGSLRSKEYKNLSILEKKNIFYNVDGLEEAGLISVYETIKPDFVINCIGVIKQLDSAQNPEITIPINSVLPHKLAKLCQIYDSKLIHFSTDCVFSGSTGSYKETDVPDAKDLYGMSKFLGEVSDQNSITLRTSIIGHELEGNKSLVNWFLSQDTQVLGYKRAIFSGLPTIEIAKVLEQYIIPNKNLNGLYHLAALPIDKLSLLRLIASTYNKDIDIKEDTNLVINRSLDSSKLNKLIGYNPPQWDDLIKSMYNFHKSNILT